MLTGRQLEAFRAVMLTRSMTRAGELLCLSQPAVSKLIRDLEQEVGFSLFSRRRGGLWPTVNAQLFRAEVDRSFIGLERIARVAHQIRKGQRGQLRIAALPALTSWFLPEVAAAFVAKRGMIAISIDTTNSPEDIEQIATGQADLGFAMTPTDPERVAVGEILRAACVCILPPGHRLSERSVVTLEDMAGEPFVSLADGMTMRLKIDAAFTAASIPRELHFEARWSASVTGLVTAGLGLSIVEPFSGHLFARQGGTVRPLAPVIDFSFAPILPRRTDPQPIATTFLETFKEVLTTFTESGSPVESGTLSWE